MIYTLPSWDAVSPPDYNIHNNIKHSKKVRTKLIVLIVMATLDMFGPFILTDNEVNKRVPENVIGNYAFGYINQKRVFVVRYVGRSDSDLKNEIKKQMKTDRAKGCTHFKYSIAKSVKEAFEKECRNYHDFGGNEVLNNDIHPAKPAGTKYECPVDGCEYND